MLTDLIDALKQADLDAEILIVDGGSTDNTCILATAWESRGPVRLIKASGTRGLAGDVLEGAKEALGEVIVVMDSDLSHPPKVAPRLARAILDGEADMAIGSRYIPGGGTPDWPLKRLLASRAAAALAWPLVDVKDPMSGFFAVHRKRLLETDRKADGFKVGLELLVAGGDELRVIEIPIVFHDRSLGHSKMGANQIMAYLKRLPVLAGGNVSMRNAGRFAFVGSIGLCVDLLTFQILWMMQFSLATSHISSFFLATITNFIINRRWTFASSTRAAIVPGDYPRFLTVGLLALFLRGAVLGVCTTMVGLPPQIAILFAILTAAGVNYLGNAFFVFALPSTPAPPAHRWRMAAFGVVTYTLLLRLLYIGQIDLIPEEAYYWNYAQHLDLSYLDHPPMVAWLIWLGTAIFGNSEFGVRIGGFVCWIITALFLYGLARSMYSKAIAFRSILLLSILPFFFVFGTFITPDTPLIACWAGSLFFLERALCKQHRLSWWGVGICIGLGMLSKYTTALLGLATLAFIILDSRSRKWLLRPEPYAAALLALLIFSPVLLWNAENDWASFVFQGSRRIHMAPDFSLHVLIASILLLLTPTGVICAIKSLWPKRIIPTSDLDEQSQARRRQLFALSYVLVPLLVFTVFSLQHVPKLNWTGPLWLALLPGMASLMLVKPVTNKVGELVRGRCMWTGTILTTLIIFGGTFHYLTLGLPGVGYSDKMRLPVAWEEMGFQIETIEDELEEIVGNEPLVVGMDKYFTASEMAFYRQCSAMSPDDLARMEGVSGTTGRYFVSGRQSLMYNYWSQPEDLVGRTFIMVSFTTEALENEQVIEHFSSVEPIQEQFITKDNKIVGNFYYRIGHSYHAFSSHLKSNFPAVDLVPPVSDIFYSEPDSGDSRERQKVGIKRLFTVSAPHYSSRRSRQALRYLDALGFHSYQRGS